MRRGDKCQTAEAGRGMVMYKRYSKANVYRKKKTGTEAGKQKAAVHSTVVYLC